jgi:hypothetical protein
MLHMLTKVFVQSDPAPSPNPGVKGRSALDRLPLGCLDGTCEGRLALEPM